MKKILGLLMMMLIVASCSLLMDDPADAFVGRYNYSGIQFVTWGSSSGTLPTEGSFMLTKVSRNIVQMTGAWNSTGTIVGNTVTFTDDLQSDASGFINYHLGTGTLSGKVLIINYSGTGSLKYSNSVSYPFYCSCQITATNID